MTSYPNHAAPDAKAFTHGGLLRLAELTKDRSPQDGQLVHSDYHLLETLTRLVP